MQRLIILFFIGVSILLTIIGCATQTSPPMQSRSGAASSGGPFTATYVSGLSNPEVTVKNSTNRTIKIFLSGGSSKSINLGSGESQTVTLTEGTYSYNVTAENVNPLSGTETFRKNYRYSWQFTIR